MSTKIKAPRGWRVMRQREKPDIRLGDKYVPETGPSRVTIYRGTFTAKALLTNDDAAIYIRRIKRGK